MDLGHIGEGKGKGKWSISVMKQGRSFEGTLTDLFWQ